LDSVVLFFYERKHDKNLDMALHIKKTVII